MIRIITNILSYGPEPAQGTEIEQHLSIKANGQCWLTRYAYQRHGDLVCIKREQFQAKTIDTLLSAMKAFFDSYDWGRYSVTDEGGWIIEADGQEGVTAPVVVVEERRHQHESSRHAQPHGLVRDEVVG